MSFGDREYFHNGPLPDWLKDFADERLVKGGNYFDDIKELFKTKDDAVAVEARVEELCKQVGLDLIEKKAYVRETEVPKERDKGKTEKWCVFSENGKRKGCHDTKEEAMNQLRAIEVNKHANNDGCYIQRVEDDVMGGFGDNQPDSRYDKDQLEKGIKVELEHTKDPEKAKEITKDHLEETKDYADGKGAKYYDKLENLEDNVEEELARAANTILNLIVLAQDLEDKGFYRAAEMVDNKVKDLYENSCLAKDKEVKELPEKFEKFEGLDSFIQNACRTSGGLASLPAIQDRIRKEFDDNIDVKNKGLEKYIKYCLKNHKELNSHKNEDEHAGEYIAIIVTEENDGNESVFDEPNGIR